MPILKTIKTLLGIDFAEQASKEVEQEEEYAARRAAMRFSRGSVGVQQGAFLTRKDLDKSLEKAD